MVSWETEAKTYKMRLDHALYRFKQKAMELRANSGGAAKFTKLRFEYCALEIEKTIKQLEAELAQLGWIEVE